MWAEEKTRDVSRETLKNNKNREQRKDNEKCREKRTIFMKKRKSMFHVKHFLDKYLEK